MRWLRDNRERYTIEAAHVYELLDEPYWSGYESVMGLWKVERGPAGTWRVAQPKRAFYEVREIVRDSHKPASTAAAE
jgi:hypothetical protein